MDVEPAVAISGHLNFVEAVEYLGFALWNSFE